ncbi:MAG: flavin reductase family protein [Acidobacteriota bacterium]|jgi:flavin reductase (DIM6/NTAB) family NADH-FMN oxidoreductase RutF
MKTSLGPKPLAFTTPVWVVGSYDAGGNPNGMTASWAGICCSSPPCINVSLRKATYSFEGLMTRRAFTISVPSEKFLREADYFGIASGRNTNKFEDTGLTPVKAGKVDAPYVEEFPLVLECRVIHTLEIGLHTLFVGEILDIKAETDVLNAEGVPDIEKVRPFVYSPELRCYHGLGGEIGKAYDAGRRFAR